MISPSRLARQSILLLLLALVAGPAFAITDRKFSTSPTLAAEARTMVQLLSQAHYNRDAVRSSNYAEVVADYMGFLDGQRMFFLKSDREEFEKRYSNSLYWNILRLGNIDAAYEIFDVYEQHV